MKFIASLLFSLTIGSIAAHADFSGTWSGTGIATTMDGTHKTCTGDLEIAQSETDFRVLSGALVCEDISGNWNNEAMEIRNGNELHYGGALVGRITPDHFEAKFPHEEWMNFYAGTMTTENEMFFQFRRMLGGAVTVLTIDIRLLRQQ